MTKRKRVLLTAIPLAILVLGIGAVLAVNMLFLFPGGQPVLRNSAEVDLREVKLTVEEYSDLAAELSDTRIVWMIPIGDQHFDSSAQEITVSTVRQEDLHLFGLFENLRQINAMEADCYDTLILLQKALPECDVQWAVHLGSGGFSPDTEALDLTGTGVTAEELTENLHRFSQLKQVTVTDTVFSLEDQKDILEAYPEVSFLWYVDISGNQFLSKDAQLSFTQKEVRLEDLLSAASLFYGVEQIDLTGCGFDTQELLAVKDAYGAVPVSELTLFGLSFTTAEAQLDFSDIPMEDTSAVEQILPLMPNLEKVVMCNCGISSEDMDAMGKRNPQIKFVWTVKIGRATIRTDITAFIGAKYGYLANANIADPREDAKNRLFDEDCTEFKYCTDMVCLDLGHMGITDYSFLAHMPKLQYLILADTHGTDFTVLENLTELIYLELFMTDFTQTELLLNLKNLKCLNLGFTDITDPSHLMEMTWLEMLWLPGTHLSYKSYLAIEEALPDTQVDYTGSHSTDHGWRKSKYYYDMRDLLDMYYLA